MEVGWLRVSQPSFPTMRKNMQNNLHKNNIGNTKGVIMANNRSLQKAKNIKNDEFYTQELDIQKELAHYTKHFAEKTVYCNCDNPEHSKFWKYFHQNFSKLGLKKLISTHYSFCSPAYMMEYTGGNNDNIAAGTKTVLSGNGDFRSQECIAYLKESDIVASNPPFSLFRDYILQLMEYEKKFIVIGNQNAITYKEIFPLFKNDQMWLGYHLGDMSFKVPNDSEPRATRFWIDDNGQKWRSLGNAMWVTNLDIDKRHEKLILTKKYSDAEYQKYDNYNAINVNKVADIPSGFDGIMGVPITFLGKYNPDQFHIIGHEHDLDGNGGDGIAHGQFEINGRGVYKRILIRKQTAE